MFVQQELEVRRDCLLNSKMKSSIRWRLTILYCKNSKILDLSQSK